MAIQARKRYLINAIEEEVERVLTAEILGFTHLVEVKKVEAK